VKLGFQIDGGVPVHRWEVWQRLQAADLTEGVRDDDEANPTGRRPGPGNGPPTPPLLTVVAPDPAGEPELLPGR